MTLISWCHFRYKLEVKSWDTLGFTKPLWYNQVAGDVATLGRTPGLNSSLILYLFRKWLWDRTRAGQIPRPLGLCCVCGRFEREWARGRGTEENRLGKAFGLTARHHQLSTNTRGVFWSEKEAGKCRYLQHVHDHREVQLRAAGALFTNLLESLNPGSSNNPPLHTLWLEGTGQLYVRWSYSSASHENFQLPICRSLCIVCFSPL